MKSIKEKALELFPEMQTDSSDCDVIEAQCDRDEQRKAFALGANYALEAIEDVLSHPRRFVSDDIYICEAMIVEITKIVEQLKDANK